MDPKSRLRPRQLRKEPPREPRTRSSGAGSSVAFVSLVGVLAGALIGLAGGYLTTSQQISHDATMRVRSERRDACISLYRLALVREDHLRDALFADEDSVDAETWQGRKRLAAGAEKSLAAVTKTEKDWIFSKTVVSLSGSDELVAAVTAVDNAVGMATEAVGFDTAAVLHGAAGLRGQVDPHPERTTMGARYKKGVEQQLFQAEESLRRSMQRLLDGCKADLAI